MYRGCDSKVILGPGKTELSKGVPIFYMRSDEHICSYFHLIWLVSAVIYRSKRYVTKHNKLVMRRGQIKTTLRTHCL